MRVVQIDSVFLNASKVIEWDFSTHDMYEAGGHDILLSDEDEVYVGVT